MEPLTEGQINQARRDISMENFMPNVPTLCNVVRELFRDIERLPDCNSKENMKLRCIAIIAYAKAMDRKLKEYKRMFNHGEHISGNPAL